MLATNVERTQKSPQIKQEDMFFPRLITKESPVANPSFRVYYREVPGSVPFMWESHPGTPKHNVSPIILPPLTPPPSYYSNHNTKTHSRRHSRSKFLNFLIFRVNVKKTSLSSTPSSLSTSSWSSSSWSSSKTSNFHWRSRFSSTTSSFDERGDYEEDEQVCIRSSPTSFMCFAGGRKGSSVVVIKKILLAMVGRGSGY